MSRVLAVEACLARPLSLTDLELRGHQSGKMSRRIRSEAQRQDAAADCQASSRDQPPSSFFFTGERTKPHIFIPISESHPRCVAAQAAPGAVHITW